MKTQMDEIGTITLGTRVHVSDPCYETTCWCAGTLENVLPRRYNCKIVRCHDAYEKGKPRNFERVKALVICHEGYICTPRERVSFEVGVDSGQAGFYDFAYYEEQHREGALRHCNEEWYERVCDTTLKALPNPHYVDRQDFIRRAMGDSFMELAQIDDAAASGAMPIAKADELRIAYMRAFCDYAEDSVATWKTIQVGYAGILDDRCCVSSSGYGDGGYDCYVARNAEGQIVAAKITFI